jgi:hypothetical protein
VRWVAYDHELSEGVAEGGREAGTEGDRIYIYIYIYSQYTALPRMSPVQSYHHAPRFTALLGQLTAHHIVLRTQLQLYSYCVLWRNNYITAQL